MTLGAVRYACCAIMFVWYSTTCVQLPAEPLSRMTQPRFVRAWGIQRWRILRGMVQAWVGHFVTPITPSWGYSLVLVVFIRQVTTTRRYQNTQHKDPTNTITMMVEPLTPLSWHGFDDPTPPEGWEALRMIFPRTPSKWFDRLNKLK